MAPRPLRPTLLFLLGLALCLTDGMVLAQSSVYRWVDGDGNVHYSDRNAPEAKRVSVATPAADPAAVADLEVVRNGEGSDVYVSNRLGGPVEVKIVFTEAQNVQAWPSLPLHQLVQARQRVLISRVEAMSDQVASYSVGMTAMPGDPGATPSDVVYALPMDEASGWQIGQGFDGGFSHSDEQNLYAVDLIVREGTPILAARGGVVMQVESAFDRAGTNRQKFAERANLVRILHEDGSMGVYAHLKENGVYVRVGQRVGVGQQIAASGNTGFTSGPHLHFCVQVNRGMRLVSVPFRMVSDRGFLPLRKR
ncbi:MAG: M23 family metallopeptidase [Arenimonas sp.]|nr:M23 family metallopeptidase [Arenimonas sp.]